MNIAVATQFTNGKFMAANFRSRKVIIVPTFSIEVGQKVLISDFNFPHETFHLVDGDVDWHLLQAALPRCFVQAARYRSANNRSWVRILKSGVPHPYIRSPSPELVIYYVIIVCFLECTFKLLLTGLLVDYLSYNKLENCPKISQPCLC